LGKKLGNFARSPIYAAIVSLLGLVAGLLGSLYTDQIKTVFPFTLAHAPISGPAVAFWSTAALATLLFFFAQTASEAQRREAERQLDTRSKELLTTIRSLPPSDFLSTFRKVFEDCSAALAEILDQPEAADALAIESALRVVLAGIAILAQKFDGAPPDLLYGSNIMVFMPSDRFTDRSIQDVRRTLRFSPPEIDLRALRGVLTLDIELSTTTQRGPDRQPDGSLTPLSLPVPHQIRDEQSKRWRVLPGAPMAFCSGNLEAYIDAETVGAWCRQQGDFPESVAAAVDTYFNSSENIEFRLTSSQAS
jgi:hypothetical protein